MGSRKKAYQSTRQPRQPLVVAGQLVGCVASGFLGQIDLQRLLDKHYKLLIGEHFGGEAWRLEVPSDAVTLASSAAITDALNTLASTLRDANLCGAWRNEQLAVTNPARQRVGTVERGAVRVLGITSCAVHLVGSSTEGHMWVQKRALTKPNNPGQWDTLMGGMVAAADSLPQALARETWEEDGLHVNALSDVAYGGHVLLRHPSSEGGGAGFIVERIDWFSAVVPEGMEPRNQDGEVDEFALVPQATVLTQVVQGLFTLEAGLVIAAATGV